MRLVREVVDDVKKTKTKDEVQEKLEVMRKSRSAARLDQGHGKEWLRKATSDDSHIELHLPFQADRSPTL